MLAFFSSSQDQTAESFTLDTKTTSLNGNVVYGSHKQIYKDVDILTLISKAKYPIYLVKSRITKQNYIMKAFAHENRHSQLYFKNESRFACLRHPNVIRHLYVEEKREAKFDNQCTDISYIMMEYAPNGDFLHFLRDHGKNMTDKLARTYFRQMIDGLEYLHKSGVSHMDIKPDNLLLDQNYTLKIADFDMAHFSEDALIISNGTKYFRAPEVARGRCNDTKAADLFAAGIILFILKTKGILPQFEKELMGGIDFSDLLYNDTEKFWKCHERLQKLNNITFDQDFKDLFVAMTKYSPNDRASIDTIKASEWYNGPCYTSEELKEKMKRLILQ